MTITMGKHSMTDDFYLTDPSEINVVLGAQWLSTLGTISQNYQTMELGFNTPDGRRIALRAMANGGPRVVSAKRMEVIFKHRDIAYAGECIPTPH